MSDTRGKSCMKGEHGSPTSNRSVSFAAHDKKVNSKTKHSSKRRRDLEKAEKLSVHSLDTVSNGSGDLVPVNKRCTEYKPRCSDLPQLTLSEIGQRGVSDIIHKGISDDGYMESSSGPQMTVVQVDQLGVSSVACQGVTSSLSSKHGAEKGLGYIKEDHS